MNAFDFITIALGSLFGRILRARSVSVSEALSAFALLALLQNVLSYIEIRSTLFKKEEGILKKDLLGMVRKIRFHSLEEIEAIVLETDGVVSVIKKSGKTGNKTYQKRLEKE